MKIVNAYPPNIEQIRAVLTPPANTVFTYGDTIYAPGIALPLSQDLIVHEEVHEKQQYGGIDPGFINPADWWMAYLVDKTFRFEQEVAAYQAQYKYFRANNSRNVSRQFARTIAKDLSGVMYGNIVDFTKALEVIKS
jgi:hypothetical protein